MTGLTLWLLLAGMLVSPMSATALELPPSGNPYYIQTNGPVSAVTLGDWYTANTAGNGYHYITFNVPCGWPSSRNIYADLFSPEMNRVSGALNQSEEPSGNYDSTQFELYAPGAGSLAPGAGIAGTRVTYPPGAAGVGETWVRYGTLTAPVACGVYTIRSQVLIAGGESPPGEGDDQNGWRLRVGWDDDGSPTNAPPADYDNPDGIAGTNDELVIGIQKTTYQHDSGATTCQTFYQYVSPGQASATFNNFDFDGNARVRYYAPSAAYDPTATAGGVVGTLSANGVWNNGGTLNTRVGDTIANPETGWWRLVACVNTHNQLIFEGQTGISTYLSQPPTPSLSISKTDGQAVASPGETLTYTIDVTNTSSGSTAGAATNVVVSDTIPTGTTYASCSVVTPASGTWSCSQSGGVVTFTQTGWINAGAAASLQVRIAVNQGATGTITNTARVDYKDALGNAFPTLTATDVDTLTPRADLSITKTDSPDPVGVGQALTYTLNVANAGPSDAQAVVVTDTLPANVSFGSATPSQGSCSQAGGVVTCNLGALGASGSASITVVVTPTAAAGVAGSVSNTASVSSSTSDPSAANNSATQGTTVQPRADVSITKTDSIDPVVAGNTVTYSMTVTNAGPSSAQNVQVTDPLPNGTSFVSATGGGAESGGTVTWNLGAMASGASTSVQLVVRVNAGRIAAISNTATVTTTTTDPASGNDSATQGTGVSTSADLSITKTDSPDPVGVGQALTYTLNVANAGPSDAQAVVVTDTLPANVSFGSATPSQGSCSQAGGVVTCNLGALGASGSASITVVVTPTAAAGVAGSVSNTASVSSSTSDPSAANNSATQGTTVTPVADLSVTIDDGTSTITAGTSTTYAITLANAGPSGVPAGVEVAVPILAGTTASTADPDCSISSGVLTCTTSSPLASGGSVAFDLTLDVSPGYALADLSVTATITSSPNADPDPSDDTDTDTDAVTRRTDLGVQITDTPDPVVPGTDLSYTIVVTNAGPSDATGVGVLDTLPAGTSFVSADHGGASGPLGVLWMLGDLPSGGSIVLSLVVHVDPDVTSALSDSAVVSSTTPDPNPGNDADIEPTAVDPQADLSVLLSDSPDPVVAGDDVTYTASVVNGGPSDATDVVLSETIPAGTTFVSATPSQGSCSQLAGVVTCDLGDLDGGASAVVDVVVTTTVAGTITAITSVSAATDDADPSNDADAEDTTVSTRVADLGVTVDDGAASVLAGTSSTYTVTLTNVAGSTLPIGAVVGIPIPPGTLATTAEPDCSMGATAIDCTTSAPLTVGDVIPWQVTLDVSPAYALPTLDVTASVLASPLPDTQPSNDTATDSDAVDAAADLGITIDDGVVTVVAGTSGTYAVTLTNGGPSTEPAGVVVTVAFPAGTVGASSSAGCSVAGVLMTCTTTSALAPGATGSWSLDLAVPSGYAGTAIDAIASVVSAPLPDPVGANDTATDSNALGTGVDLSVDIADAPDPVFLGNLLTYTLSVANAGPSDATGVIVTDPLPAGTVFVSATPSQGACAEAAGIVTCDVGSLAAGGAASITIVVTPTLLGTATDDASVIADQADLNPANDTDTETTTVSDPIDVSITIADAPDPAGPGQDVGYSMTVANAGPMDATGVTVTFPVPAGATLVSAVPSQGTCSLAGGVVTCDLVGLTAGASATIAAVVTPSGPGTVTASASVTSAQTDTAPGNNSAVAVTTVLAPGAADLSITKSDSPDPAPVAQSITYTLTVSNAGPDAATSTLVTDPLPVGLSFVSAMPSQGTCSAIGATVTCDLGTVAAASTVTVSIVATPTIAGTVTNTASVQSALADPDPNDNSASQITTIAASADLSIVKTAAPSAITVGQDLTYTLAIANAGPSDATSVVVTDPLPPGSSFVSATASQGTCAEVAGTVTCDLGNVAAGAGANVTILVTTTAAGVLTNTAQVAAAEFDPDPTDNSASQTTTVDGAAGLSIMKTASPDPVIAGNDLTYTLVVSNAGPSEATSVVVTDPLPAGATFISATSGGTLASGVVTWSIASVAAGASVTLTLVVEVGTDVEGTLTNTASVGSAEADPDPTDNSDSVSVTVDPPGTPEADLSIEKVADVQEPESGDIVRYTITVSNAGPADATGIVVEDVLPKGLEFRSADASQGHFDATTGRWKVGDLAVDDEATLVLETLVTGKAGTSIENVAGVVKLDQADPGGANDEAQVDIEVLATTVDPADPSATAMTGGAYGGFLLLMLLFGALGTGALSASRRLLRGGGASR